MDGRPADFSRDPEYDRAFKKWEIEQPSQALLAAAGADIEKIARLSSYLANRENFRSDEVGRWARGYLRAKMLARREGLEEADQPLQWEAAQVWEVEKKDGVWGVQGIKWSKLDPNSEIITPENSDERVEVKPQYFLALAGTWPTDSALNKERIAWLNGSEARRKILKAFSEEEVAIEEDDTKIEIGEITDAFTRRLIDWADHHNVGLAFTGFTRPLPPPAPGRPTPKLWPTPLPHDGKNGRFLAIGECFQGSLDKVLERIEREVTPWAKDFFERTTASSRTSPK